MSSIELIKIQYSMMCIVYISYKALLLLIISEKLSDIVYNVCEKAD